MSTAAAFSARWDDAEMRAVVAALQPGPMKRAVRKAGSSALRTMKRETSKRVRERYAIRVKYIKRDVVPIPPRGVKKIDGMQWSIGMKGTPMPLIAFRSARQTRKGVTVTVKKGKRTLIPGAFIATMRSGRRGVFKRKTRSRLPIRELYGSRIIDAMDKPTEAFHVLKRGRDEFGRTWERVLPIELDKG